jgi:hypothetical protein
MIECEHGIVAGVCGWCQAAALDFESAVIASLRDAAYAAEMEAARRRAAAQ